MRLDQNGDAHVTQKCRPSLRSRGGRGGDRIVADARSAIQRSGYLADKPGSQSQVEPTDNWSVIASLAACTEGGFRRRDIGLCPRPAGAVYHHKPLSTPRRKRLLSVLNG